jgi:hypothetical protein
MIVCVAVFEQPVPASVYEYVITCVPTPATTGLNDEPLTPVPLNVPPTGVAVSALALAFTHIGALLLVIVTNW